MTIKKRIAIKDIAKQLNISQTTISFVLNGKADAYGISKALETKILTYIEHIGYVPSKIAQGLRTGKSKTIGMIVEDISDPFFSSISRIVEQIAYAQGYRVIFGSSENDPAKAIDLIQNFRNHNVDGFIIAPPPGIDAVVQQLVDQNFPVVLFDRSLPGVDCPKVIVNNFEGTAEAINHLIKNGYDKVAMITLNSQQDQMLDRLNAYQSVMKTHGLNPVVKMVAYDEDKSNVVKVIRSFIKSHKDVNALFFSTNYLAMSGLEALQSMKVDIRKSMGLVVFDDSPYFALFSPSLTAIAQPVPQIAAEVIGIMLSRLGIDEDHHDHVKVLQTTLVIRDSSSKLMRHTVTNNAHPIQ